MTTIGDSIYLLIGGSSAYVLVEPTVSSPPLPPPPTQPETSLSSSPLELIGPCYVPGLMAGEGLVAARRGCKPKPPPETEPLQSSDMEWLGSLGDVSEYRDLGFSTEAIVLL
jgi:hypothetical protein